VFLMVMAARMRYVLRRDCVSTSHFRRRPSATVSAIVVVALVLPEVPVMVTVDVPAVAVALAVSVSTLVLVVGLVANAAVTPLGRRMRPA